MSLRGDFLSPSMFHFIIQSGDSRHVIIHIVKCHVVAGIHSTIIRTVVMLNSCHNCGRIGLSPPSGRMHSYVAWFAEQCIRDSYNMGLRREKAGLHGASEHFAFAPCNAAEGEQEGSRY